MKERTRKYMKYVLSASAAILCIFALGACKKEQVTSPKETPPRGEEFPKILSMPTGLAVEDWALKWEAVEHADGYCVSVDGQDFYTDSTTYDLYDYLVPDERYSLSVSALGDGETYLDSDFADLDYQAPAPTKGLAYSLIDGGEAYAVYSPNKAYITRGELVLPDEYQGKPITEIAEMGFGITIPVNVPSDYVLDRDFIRAVRLPAGLKKINSSAFFFTSVKTVHLPKTLEEIGDSAFAITELTEITIPQSVTKIGAGAFGGKTLTKVEVLGSPSMEWNVFSEKSVWYQNQPNGYIYFNKTLYRHKGDFPAGTVLDEFPQPTEKIADGAFRDCKGLTEIVVPADVEINGSVFDGCQDLKKVSFAEGVTTIPNGMFVNCTALEEVVIPEGVEVLTDSTFRGCPKLKRATLPQSLTKIGDYVFNECVALCEIELPSALEEIGYAAFKGCKRLESISIPDSVTELGEYIFEGCERLEEVVLPQGLTTIPSVTFKDCRALSTIVIPDSVTTIGESAFNGCTGLTSIILSNGVKKIGVSAFNGCTGLTNIAIPNSVTSLGIRAFADCMGLTSITIPNSVTWIGPGAFAGCTGLTALTAEEGGWYSSIDGSLYHGTEELCLYAPWKEAVEIPASVTTIGYGAFYDNLLVKSVVIPSTVKVIIYNAFEGCSNLTSLTLKEGLEEIGANAFKNCKSLTSVVIPDSVTLIDYSAFTYCSALESVVIGSGVKTMGQNPFSGCKKLTSAVFKDPKGWSSGGILLSEEVLSDPTTAAVELVKMRLRGWQKSSEA